MNFSKSWPESWTGRFPFLEAFEDDWAPVPPWALAAWTAFFLFVIIGAWAGGGPARWMDLVFVPIHEGGHLLFGWLGVTWLMVAGGTLLQLFVPFALAAYFAFRRQIFGAAFCSFFFFEQFLPVGTYMADARAQALSYVTVGDPDQAVHDWWYLFSHMGLLEHGVQIGTTVRALGWLGMLTVTVWLVWRGWGLRSVAASRQPSLR